MLPFNQRGVSQILLPLFLLAAIGLTVYLAQRPTGIIPHAQDSCPHLNPNPETSFPTSPTSGNDNYRVINSSVTQSGVATIKSRAQKTTSEGFAIKTEWSDGRISFDFKDQSGKLLKDKSYIVRGTGSDCKKYMKRGGQNDVMLTNGNVVVTVFEDGTVEYNKFFRNSQGEDDILYNPDQSYSECCNKDYQFTQGTNFTANTAGSGKTGVACTKPGDCQSGTCTNQKCDATGSKAGGDSCQNGPECQSGTCSNGKCAGGKLANGKACNENSECASNKCGTDNKCTSSTSNTTNNTTSNKTNNTTNNSSSNNTSGSTASTSPTTSAAPAASIPAASTTTSTTPVSLTKVEITGFKSSFDALDSRLGTASGSGNLSIVAGIARNELNSIVSQLPTCPDDANVGTCLDTKFRTRFDLAKTAARLSAFYGIFNNVSGLCVKSDFGLNPLITATSTTSATGRVNLCSEPTAAKRIWKIFVNSKFEDVLSTDTRFPADPTCASLPQDVLSHYRNAETLFNTQPGFTQNTLCDGKTTVAPGGGI